jgi:hypothetical protein
MCFILNVITIFIAFANSLQCMENNNNNSRQLIPKATSSQGEAVEKNNQIKNCLWNKLGVRCSALCQECGICKKKLCVNPKLRGIIVGCDLCESVIKRQNNSSVEEIKAITRFHPKCFYIYLSKNGTCPLNPSEEATLFIKAHAYFQAILDKGEFGYSCPRQEMIDAGTKVLKQYQSLLEKQTNKKIELWQQPILDESIKKIFAEYDEKSEKSWDYRVVLFKNATTLVKTLLKVDKNCDDK